MHHELKIEAHYLNAIFAGEKTFEIRKNDRGFQVGDSVTMTEYYPESMKILRSKRSVTIKITYVTDYMQTEGFVVFSFKINQ